MYRRGANMRNNSPQMASFVGIFAPNCLFSKHKAHLINVRELSTAYPPLIHRIYTVCPQVIHRVIHSISTAYPQRIHRVYTACPQVTHSPPSIHAREAWVIHRLHTVCPQVQWVMHRVYTVVHRLHMLHVHRCYTFDTGVSQR